MWLWNGMDSEDQPTGREDTKVRITNNYTQKILLNGKVGQTIKQTMNNKNPIKHTIFLHCKNKYVTFCATFSLWQILTATLFPIQ